MFYSYIINVLLSFVPTAIFFFLLFTAYSLCVWVIIKVAKKITTTTKREVWFKEVFMLNVGYVYKMISYVILVWFIISFIMCATSPSNRPKNTTFDNTKQVQEIQQKNTTIDTNLPIRDVSLKPELNSEERDAQFKSIIDRGNIK